MSVLHAWEGTIDKIIGTSILNGLPGEEADDLRQDLRIRTWLIVTHPRHSQRGKDYVCKSLWNLANRTITRRRRVNGRDQVVRTELKLQETTFDPLGQLSARQALLRLQSRPEWSEMWGTGIFGAQNAFRASGLSRATFYRRVNVGRHNGRGLLGLYETESVAQA